MRFHIGFSKHLKTKSLFWFAISFLAFMTFFISGLQQVKAYELGTQSVDLRRKATPFTYTNLNYNRLNPLATRFTFTDSNYTAYYNRGSGGTTFNNRNYIPITEYNGTKPNYNLLASGYSSDYANIFTNIRVNFTNDHTFCSNYSDTKSFNATLFFNTISVNTFNYRLSEQYAPGYNWTDKGLIYYNSN